MGDRIVVISTERNAPAENIGRCISSVAQQTLLKEDYRHIFIDDGSPTGKQEFVVDTAELWSKRTGARCTVIQYPEGAGRCSLQNVWEVIQGLEDSAIVVWVDGDDWLADEHALVRVWNEYQRPDKEVWLTWGQFVFADGKPGWATRYPPEIVLHGTFRHDVWRATHLKTFRAGLFKRIKVEDLGARTRTSPDQPAPVWQFLRYATDLATMFPMLEMARERSSFIPDVLYTYSGPGTPEGFGPGTPSWVVAEAIRGMTKYERLEARPW